MCCRSLQRSLRTSATLLFPERNRVDREFGDRRDIGVKVEKKLENVFYYMLGFTHGKGLYCIVGSSPDDSLPVAEVKRLLAEHRGEIAKG